MPNVQPAVLDRPEATLTHSDFQYVYVQAAIQSADSGSFVGNHCPLVAVSVICSCHGQFVTEVMLFVNYNHKIVLTALPSMISVHLLAPPPLGGQS